MKTIFKRIVLLISVLTPFLSIGQTNGTITIKKPCKNCVQNNFLTGTNELRIKLDRKDSFKNKEIKCYTIRIFTNDTLLTCVIASPDTVNTIMFIPPGIYNVLASADETTVAINEVKLPSNKKVYLNFEFEVTEAKKRIKKKSNLT
jgi:hypothetical protein